RLIRSVDCQSRAQIHNRAEKELIRQTEDAICNHGVRLIVQRSLSGHVSNRWVVIVEVPEEVIRAPLVVRMREGIRDRATPAGAVAERPLNLELQRVIPRLDAIVRDE